ncbi:MAG: hypothetical protein ABI158_01630, partial [Edaphobacter sp.]
MFFKPSIHKWVPSRMLHAQKSGHGAPALVFPAKRTEAAVHYLPRGYFMPKLILAAALFLLIVTPFARA